MVEPLEKKAGDSEIKLPHGMYVEGNGVYKRVIGGPSRKVGYIGQDGKPYQMIIGGPPRPIVDLRFD